MSELAKKLQLKATTLAVLNAPAGLLARLAAELDGVTVSAKAGGAGKARGSCPAQLLFVNNLDEAMRLSKQTLAAAAEETLVWIAYPKGGSKIKTDVNRDTLVKAMEDTGWRPVRQIALDETWSAMRFRPEKLVGK